MVKQVTVVGPRDVVIEELPDEDLRPRTVRVRALLSGISHGTELSYYRGVHPNVRKQFDGRLGLFVRRSRPESAYPQVRGYENVGQVVEVASDVAEIRPGDIVCARQPHRSGYVAEETSVALLPHSVDPTRGVFVHRLGFVLNALWDSGFVFGDNVVVFGMGVLGLVLVQLLRLAGAGRIVAIDPIPLRLALAERFGADVVLDPKQCQDLGVEVRALTKGAGADIVFECSGSASVLHTAIRTACSAGTVALVSAYAEDASPLFLGEEFLLNRVTLVSAYEGGIRPGLSPRWTLRRREEVAAGLLAKLRFSEMVTHVIPFMEAPRAYRLIDQHPQDVIQVVLTYA